MWIKCAFNNKSINKYLQIYYKLYDILEKLKIIL